MKPPKTDFFADRSGICRRHFEEYAVYYQSGLDFALDADGEYSDPKTDHCFAWFGAGYSHPDFSLKDIVAQISLKIKNIKNKGKKS